jgi:hypothetical protein
MALAVWITVGFGAASAADIETTYGEDPVPPRHFMWRPFKAYGMDPVPEKSARERWMLYRARSATWPRANKQSPQPQIETLPTPPPEQAEQPRSSRRTW